MDVCICERGPPCCPRGLYTEAGLVVLWTAPATDILISENDSTGHSMACFLTLTHLSEKPSFPHVVQRGRLEMESRIGHVEKLK
jgi:hypothetical protein